MQYDSFISSLYEIPNLELNPNEFDFFIEGFSNALGTDIQKILDKPLKIVIDYLRDEQSHGQYFSSIKTIALYINPYIQNIEPKNLDLLKKDLLKPKTRKVVYDILDNMDITDSLVHEFTHFI